MEQQEKKNRRIGFLTSLGIHATLFVVLFFMMAWRAPNPPLPEYGIELNFGMDQQGSGEVQPEAPVGDVTEEKVIENSQEETQAVPEKVTEENKEAVAEAAVEKLDSKVESPVTVKEEKKEVKAEPRKEKPAETSQKEKVVAEYKKDEKKEVSPTDASKKGVEGSQGDDANKTGDKGSPQGTLDAKALYGTPGGGGGGTGMNLQMAGWAWADQPKVPELPDNDGGRVTFEIECDENGDITGINAIERGLSPAAEKILKEVIQSNALVRTAGTKPPEKSKGKIVFILRTK